MPPPAPPPPPPPGPGPGGPPLAGSPATFKKVPLLGDALHEMKKKLTGFEETPAASEGRFILHLLLYCISKLLSCEIIRCHKLLVMPAL